MTSLALPLPLPLAAALLVCWPTAALVAFQAPLAVQAAPAAQVPQPAPAAPASLRPAIVTCAGTLVRGPREIAISCADGGIAVDAIRWTAWTMNGALGSGRLVVNRCVHPEGPACVAGRTDAYPVTLSLGRLATGPLPSGSWGSVFTELELQFPQGGPIGFHSASYRIDNRLR